MKYSTKKLATQLLTLKDPLMLDLQIKTFTFLPGLPLRTTLWKDDNPWFVAKDVCNAVGLQPHTTNGGMGHHLLRLDEDEVISTRNMEITTTGSGMHNAKWVSESGLYSLILRSEKPEAKQFRKWVTSEVLPSIRKTGGYVTKETAEAMLESPEVMLSKALLFATDRLKQEEAKSLKLAAKVEVLAVQGKGLESEDIPMYTVKEFCALRKIGLDGSERKKLGRLAAAMAEVAGRERPKRASLFVGNDGETKQGSVNVHTINALERAVDAIKQARSSAQRKVLAHA